MIKRLFWNHSHNHLKHSFHLPAKYIIFLDISGTKWLGTKSIKFSTTAPALLHSTAKGGFS